MQEYIQELQEKAGLTEEQATKAVIVLFEKVKSKIPEPLQGMVENLFADKKEGDSLQDKVRKFEEKAKTESKDFMKEAEDRLSDFMGKK